jgi:dipeptidyl-peptidase III
MTLQVAIHELLGHGTGKLFTKNVETGELNYDPDTKNPFTGEPITTNYLSTETWGQKFGKLHSGYEECRADTVALHLINFDEPFEIFCPDKTREEWDNIYYGCWLSELTGAIKGLQFYNAEDKAWGQAHIWGRWVIFQACYQGDPELFKVELCKDEEGKDSFMLGINRERLRTTGFKALTDFLHKLHVYKSIGDVETAKKFFDHYSQVDEFFLKIRDIVINNKKPRRLELQPNVVDKEYQDYPETFAGIISSYTDGKRFTGGEFQKDVYDLWLKHADRVRMQV